jgi:hypothetical protein
VLGGWGDARQAGAEMIKSEKKKKEAYLTEEH